MSVEEPLLFVYFTGTRRPLFATPYTLPVARDATQLPWFFDSLMTWSESGIYGTKRGPPSPASGLGFVAGKAGRLLSTT